MITIAETARSGNVHAFPDTLWSRAPSSAPGKAVLPAGLKAPIRGIAPDGSFLIPKREDTSPKTAPITVILDWFAELE